MKGENPTTEVHPTMALFLLLEVSTVMEVSLTIEALHNEAFPTMKAHPMTEFFPLMEAYLVMEVPPLWRIPHDGGSLSVEVPP